MYTSHISIYINIDDLEPTYCVYWNCQYCLIFETKKNTFNRIFLFLSFQDRPLEHILLDHILNFILEHILDVVLEHILDVVLE